jgi:hypothetical protein
MAANKGALASIRGAVGALLSRLPFAKKASAPTPEPFEAIEDETPIGDLLSTANAAPIPGKGLGGDRPDLKALASSAIKSPPILIGSGVALVFLLALAITAIVVNSPAKSAEAPKPFVKEGEALVRSWLPPPGDPIERPMALEREGAQKYGLADAARIGIDPNPSLRSRLADANDLAIDDLFGTVP